MAEIPRERFAIALETTKGTAVTTPTHIIPVNGAMGPQEDKYTPDEKRGTYHERYRSATARRWCEWEGNMGLDTRLLPVLCEIGAKSGGVKTTPGGATNARLWTYIDATGVNDLKTATSTWGDPSTQIFQSSYTTIDEMTITADGEGTDGTMMNFTGHGQYWTKVSAPVDPAQIIGPMIMPADFQVWIDPAASIGTTAITGRVTKIEHVLTNNLSYKFIPQGPTGKRTYSRTGRGKRMMATKLTFEFLDTTQYDQWDAETIVGVRVRHNGPIIETTLRHYVEVDTYGPWSEPAWAEHEGTNRTLELTVYSEVDSTLGSGWAIKIQNDRDTL